MGSDGFESKRPGGSALGGSGSRSLGANDFHSGEFPGPRDRSSAADPFLGAGDGVAANLVEVSGVIKWFDASKGYGFIIPDNGWPDVLLHVTVLRRDGYQTAYEGARIVVECLAFKNW